MKNKKKWGKSLKLIGSAALFTLTFHTGVFAKEVNTQPSSYKTVTEVEDWGAVISKVIIDIGRPIPVDSVTKDTFTVHVERSDSRLANPILEQGLRNVTNAYVADGNGKPAVKMGKHVVLELEIGPNLSLSSAINYDWAGTGFNDWTQNKYTITQQKEIQTKAGTVSGLVVDTYPGGVRELVDEFTTGTATYIDVTLSYAEYSPGKDNKKNPLIIWLHGAGEGGTDPTMAIAGNKAVNFASEEIQSHFDGAYVLAPQTPTLWMNGKTGFGDGTSIYQDALMALIDDYVSNNKDIDTSRIYIGGDSNGGYMTMLMIRDYTDYFAAAFPTCEALLDSLITDEEIQKMADLPIWFIAAETDTIVNPANYTVPTYNRLVEAGAGDVHLSLFNNVIDTSGLYTNDDGTPYEYNGHWSWIYVYNNDVSEIIDGKETTLMEWLAAQTK
ncbi:prolyl oligopeptidase family serine peptidase [Litchfieldia salsa]|uniref:Predicted peptidase n=1 Tax=Litchfieldia salsa TaxID=930152 RepID=A0A1H0Q3Z3_9BACI|nr:prolyl oligopeptidase family serine peptidase [Litchfieldia salsa]SDP12103.1 Predicted peptidase [Litchfieldia salsa]